MDKEKAVAICDAIDKTIDILAEALAISRSHETRIAALENAILRHNDERPPKEPSEPSQVNVG